MARMTRWKGWMVITLVLPGCMQDFDAFHAESGNPSDGSSTQERYADGSTPSREGTHDASSEAESVVGDASKDVDQTPLSDRGGTGDGHTARDAANDVSVGGRADGSSGGYDASDSAAINDAIGGKVDARDAPEDPLVPDSGPIDPRATCESLNGVISAISRHCYFPLSDAKSWQAQEARCRTGGAYLVAIGTEEEDTLVRSLRAYPNWIGMRKKDSVLAWSNGEAINYSHWALNPSQSVDACGLLLGDEGWSLVSCESKMPAICERP